MKNKAKLLIANLLFVLIFSAVAFGQTTEFTYQGKLNDNAAAANGSYDFEFRLFAASTDGAPIGTQVRPGVQVAGGIFTVQLDFGAQFSGENRFLEIAVKPAGSQNGFTTLMPRQPVTSAPYSIRSLNSTTADNALNLGGVAANQFVQTNDARLSDDRNPLAGSSNYIQNTTTQQASSSFNISGTGTANIFNAATQFNIGGSRVLSVPGENNTFVGINVGGSITTASQNTLVGDSVGVNLRTGEGNTFFGRGAGNLTVSGNVNTFLGFGSGGNNSTGSNNTTLGSRADVTSGNLFYATALGASSRVGTSDTIVLGKAAGIYGGVQRIADNVLIPGSLTVFGSFNLSGNGTITADNIRADRFLSGDGFFNTFLGNETAENNTGANNTMVGYRAGFSNTTGSANTFLGRTSGELNTTGGGNAFVGYRSGLNNSSGDRNVFFGTNAGITNTTGNDNTMIGSSTNVASNNLSFATAIGAGSTVSTSNTIALGRNGGQDTVRIYGNLIVDGTITNLNSRNEASAAQIEELQKQIREQKVLIDALKNIVCGQNPTAEICREPKQ